jgi:coenzyme F420-0:L-glutamate ligase/coenzyme F420-1:gamma-L-glutamate ligase
MASWTSDVRRFLDAHRVGRLATVGADGTPHAVPVCYALDDAGLYVVADAKPKRGPARRLARLENLRRHPRAALVVDEYDDDWSRLRWVMVRGPVEFIREPTAHAAALTLLRARYPQYRAMPLDDLDAHPIFRLAPERVLEWSAT